MSNRLSHYPLSLLRPPLGMAVVVSILLPLTLRAGETVAKSASPPLVEKKKETKEKSFLSFWDGRLVIDIEERIRGEIRENNRDFNAAAHDDTDDSWLLNRFRFGLAVKPVSWLKLYGQGQDSREAFSDRANIPGVHGAEGDDEWDLRQAYVALGDLKRFPLQLTVWRQSITYGDGRLVADSKWGNFGRTFDAIRARFEEPHYWIEAFAMRPVQIERHQFDASDAENNFFGGYFSTDLVPKQTTDFYVFYQHKNDDQPDLDPTNRIDPQGTWNGPAARFVTLGVRIKSTPDKLNGWDYSAEGAYEVGDLYQTDLNSKRFDLNAFAFAVSGGYTFKACKWQPRIGLEFDYASGDKNPNDNKSESFQNLFPSNHNKYGLMDEFAWRNLGDLRLQVNAKPVKKLELEFDFHAFWLANTHDFWYRGNGNSIVRARTPDGQDVRTIGASRFVGNEVDLIATYELNKNIKFQTGYSHFFPGQYLVDTGPHSAADFAYLMTTFSY